MRLKLTIEPIPVSTWGRSLANRLPKQEWDDLRTKVYRKADYKCEICRNNKLTLHAHEIWKFDDRKAIQHLVGLECLCELCHNVKHMGRSKAVYGQDYIDKLIEHWCKVNRRTKGDFAVHEAQIFETNKKRVDKYYIVKVGRKVLV